MKIATIANIIMISLSVAVIGFLDYSDHEASVSRYCEMVEDYQRSEGESGWPDFNENYDEVCSENR